MWQFKLLKNSISMIIDEGKKQTAGSLYMIISVVTWQQMWTKETRNRLRRRKIECTEDSSYRAG